MKAKKEFIIGIVSIIGIMGLIVGFFFLKGQEVWKSRATYYTIYKNSEGLTTGRPINLNGLQVGIITNVFEQHLIVFKYLLVFFYVSVCKSN